MENQEKVMPTHKWIVIEDLNRELSPIGHSFQSPIYRPSKFPIDTIRQLLNISKVTAMFEVYKSDPTLRVKLDNSNFRKPFEDIWAEQYPETPFPWANSVETVQEQTSSYTPAAELKPADPALQTPAPASDQVITGAANEQQPGGNDQNPDSTETTDSVTGEGEKTDPPADGQEQTGTTTVEPDAVKTQQPAKQQQQQQRRKN